MDGVVRTFRELEVYTTAFGSAVEIFTLTKGFPVEEKYSLTDQMRRSSRSICANIAEAWRKRRYEAAFIAKLNDAEAECAETQVWLDFSREFGYVNKKTYSLLDEKYDTIAGMLVRMITTSKSWIIKPAR